MKSTLTAIALCTVLATGATTSAEAACGSCAPVCNTCAPRVAHVQFERVCTTCNTCDPCASRGFFGMLNPMNW